MGCLVTFERLPGRVIWFISETRPLAGGARTRLKRSLLITGDTTPVLAQHLASDTNLVANHVVLGKMGGGGGGVGGGSGVGEQESWESASTEIPAETLYARTVDEVKW